MNRAFDLRDGERVLARLRQRGWGSDADLDVGGRAWKLDASGILRWTLRVVDEKGNVRATLPLGWRGQGTVVLGDGRRFAFEPESFWGKVWSIDDDARVQVARVSLAHFLRMDATVDAYPPRDLSDDDLVALLAITWHSLVVTTQAAVVAGG